MSKRNFGFSAFELLTVIVIAGLVGLAGYTVYHKGHPAKAPTTATVPARIENKSDIKQASQSLDSQNLDQDLDTTQLDSQIKALL